MNKHAQIVVIGAGIVGSSAAYYLAHYGCQDVLVIDKGELYENDGSTSHAPGGVNPLSNNPTMARLAGWSIDLYESLPVWKPERRPLYMVGGVDVARTAARMDEVKRLYTNGKGFGVEVHMITPSDISDLFPLMDGRHFVGGLFTPRKPVVSGAHVCGSLAAEAEKTCSVTFVGHTKAIDFVIENGRITAIKTDNPAYETIYCEQALLCTNIWTPALTEKIGVNIPLMPAEHQYLKSEPLPELAHASDRTNPDNFVIYPSVRDMDGGLYYRNWWDSIGMGNYHHRPIMRESRTLGKSADHPFTPADFVDAHAIADATIPALKGRDYPYKINGMFSFSVDGLPIMGETAVHGLWVAASLWITNGGGAGKAIAQWMLTGQPETDMRSLSIDRFLPYQKTAQYRHIACTKAYVEVHDVIHPAQTTSKPRNVRHTPLHQRHVELGASFTVSAGLEIPHWLGENEHLLEKYDDQIPTRTGWGAQYWSRIQGAEHLAMRDAVGMFDLTSLAIIEIAGTDAQAFTDYVCTNRIDMPVGRITYTLLCTPNGGIKRDVAVSRVAAGKYWLFTGNGTLPQEMAWLQKWVGDHTVTIRDLSTHYAAIGLFGPHARDVLAQVSAADISNEAFPFYSWQALEIGMAHVYAMRISYVGELGWELHMPMDVALAVRDQIWAAGQSFGLVSCGVGAMRSMRVEKGYRLWGSDIHTEHNPYEAGMGWLVKLKKGEFVGRTALQTLKKQPLTRRLVTLTIDHPNAVPTGNEPLFADGKMIGQITSGNYGYSIGKYIAFAYLPMAYTQPGTLLEIEYLAERFPAVVTADTLFDPANTRLKS